MKVFLSHQSTDTPTALLIQRWLADHHGISSYLDVIDPYFNRSGEDLAAHIRAQMSACTKLLAVISDATKASQWVPWEVGVATEKDYPLATYSAASTLPPEFLRKWPYLRSTTDIDRYAIASKAAARSFANKRITLTEAMARARSTGEFYTSIRSALGQ